MNDTQKELEKQLLDIQKQKKIREAEDRFNEHGINGKLLREIGIIEAEYSIKKHLIGEDKIDQTPGKIINNESKTEIRLLKRKPFLKDLGKKNLRLRRLEKLFIERDSAPFKLIAYKIGLVKTQGQYIASKYRKVIINLQKKFNKGARINWKVILSSTQNVPFDGLRLIGTSKNEK